jgi:hypothetical protein
MDFTGIIANFVIRPPRNTYPDDSYQTAPLVFQDEGINIK